MYILKKMYAKRDYLHMKIRNTNDATTATALQANSAKKSCFTLRPVMQVY